MGEWAQSQMSLLLPLPENEGQWSSLRDISIGHLGGAQYSGAVPPWRWMGGGETGQEGGGVGRSGG